MNKAFVLILVIAALISGCASPGQKEEAPLDPPAVEQTAEPATLQAEPTAVENKKPSVILLTRQDNWEAAAQYGRDLYDEGKIDNFEIFTTGWGCRLPDNAIMPVAQSTHAMIRADWHVELFDEDLPLCDPVDICRSIWPWASNFLYEDVPSWEHTEFKNWEEMLAAFDCGEYESETVD